MFWLWFLWEIIVNGVEYYFFYYVLKKQLGYASTKKRLAVLSTIVLILILTMMNYFDLDFRILMLITMGLELLYSVILFNGTLAMRIIWGSSGSLVALTSNLLTSVILTSLGNLIMQDTLLPSIARLIATIIYTLLCILISLALSRIPRTSISLPRNLQIFIIIVVAVGTILAGQIVAFALGEHFSELEHNLLVAFSFSLLFMLFAIIFLVHKIGSVIQKEADTENKLRSAQLEQQNQERLQEVMHLWNHDQHHHINALQSYVLKKDLNGVGQYLREMNSELEALTTLVNTSNSVIDGILTSKIHICRAEKIAFKINAKNLEDFPLSKMETSSLLGNLLDNAIDACKKCHTNESIYIECNIYKKRGMYAIIVTNSSNGDYCYDAGELATSKPEGFHGYGLPQIKQIIEEANGIYRISNSQKKFRFELYLPDTKGGNS